LSGLTPILRLSGGPATTRGLAGTLRRRALRYGSKETKPNREVPNQAESGPFVYGSILAATIEASVNLLSVIFGQVIAQCQPRHRQQEFLRFLQHIDGATDPALEVHLILDNYSTHKHSQVKKWFRAHPRYHLHFTPTSASWLNQVERWFAEITRKRIRRGTFHSVPELVKVIQDYIRENNKNPRPFRWVASANTIIRKVRKYKWTLETAD
jgi:transposase